MHTLLKLLNESMKDSRLGITNNFIQHGDTSCLLHSIAVAYYSCRLASIMHINLSKKELIRGVLLHDYFLYDWHIGKGHKIHGFTHPKAFYEALASRPDTADCGKGTLRNEG